MSSNRVFMNLQELTDFAENLLTEHTVELCNGKQDPYADEGIYFGAGWH